MSHQDPDPLGIPRVRALAMDIAYRLRPLCGHLPEGDLVKLATRLAIAQDRSGSAKHGRRASGPPSPPPPDAA